MTHQLSALRHGMFLLLLSLFVCTMIAPASMAANSEIDYDQVYHFSLEDFAAADASAAPRGIILTAVPEETVGAFYYGNRQLCAGDAITAEAFQKLRFEPTCLGDVSADFHWIPVFSTQPAQEMVFRINIGNGKNQPPTAENSTLETYRNISIDGQLKFSDPDDETLSFALIKDPKRGSVSINPDGSYVYTPEKNKVGNDSFTVQMTDSAGNTAEATVKVTIIKPTDKSTFADLAGDNDQYFAMWLREQGIYSGQALSGTLLFQPEQSVSRGEFLVMAMDLLDIPADAENLSTGFADETDTPAWMRPYLVAALRSGFISGVASPDGLCFRHSAAITQAEAAVMLDNMLGLSPTDAVSVFADDEIPAWASDAVACLSSYGIRNLSQPTETMTMRQVATLFYDVHTLIQSEQLSLGLLAWAADA